MKSDLSLLCVGVCGVADACQWHLIVTVSAYSHIGSLKCQKMTDLHDSGIWFACHRLPGI